MVPQPPGSSASRRFAPFVPLLSPITMSKRTLIAAVVVLGLGAGVAAQSRPSLQDRVDALSQQIHLRYQHYAPALAPRRAAAEEVLAAWNRVAPLGEQGASDENTARLSDWLDAALRAVMPGGSGVLPAAPEFEAPVVINNSDRNNPGRRVPEEAVPAAPRELAEPTDTAPAPEAEAAKGPRQEPRQSRLKVIDPVTTIDNPYVNDSASASPRPTAKQPSVNPLRQSPRAANPIIGVEPVESQFAGPRATAKPVVPATDAPQSDPDTPQRSKWSQHPSAAPLEWRDPFTDDPTASPNPLRSGSRHEARRPEYRQSRSAQPRSTTVNLRELSADIRGYNAAIRSLQSAVTGFKKSDAAALEAAEEELGRLEERRQFLDLYRAGLTADEQRLIPESASSEVVRELVRRKTETLSDRASSSQREERRAQQADWFDSF